MYGVVRGPDIEALRVSLRTLSASAAAREVDLHLRQNREHVRDFFRTCFPVLLRRIFGFEEGITNAAAPAATSGAYTGGWLQQTCAPGYELDARALINLLAPTGLLMQSLLATDKEGVVKYTFPMERLPDWTRRLLATEQGVAALCEHCPTFRGHVFFEGPGRAQVHLDIFQYFIFWFAYYMVCKDTATLRGVRGSAPVSGPASRPSSLQHWPSLKNVTIPGLHQSAPAPVKPYRELLQMYLRHFLALSSPSMQLPSQRAAFAMEGGAVTGKSGQEQGAVTHADILLHTLVQFWLMDDDPAPFSAASQQLIQATAPIYGQPASIGYAPAGEELLESIQILITYLGSNRNLAGLAAPTAAPSAADLAIARVTSRSGALNESGSSGRLAGSGAGNLYSRCLPPASQVLQRPLYRFLLRSLGGWPVNGQLARVASLVDLWVKYLEPWKLQAGRPAHHSSSTAHFFGGDGGQQQAPVPSYDERWRGYVLANLPFYSTLLLHFLELACKALQVDCDAAVNSLVKLLKVLERSPGLVELLRSVEGAYSSYLAVQHPTTPFADFLPGLVDQLKEWESGLEGLGGPSGGSRVTGRGGRIPTSVPRLRLFGRDPDAAPQLLQAMLLRLQAELQASVGGRSPVSLEAVRCLEGLSAKVLTPQTPPPLSLPPASLGTAQGTSRGGAHQQEAASVWGSVAVDRDQALTGAAKQSEDFVQRGLPRNTWADVHYRGDWMRRPIQASEVAFLVRLLVRLSEAANDYLGLDQPPGGTHPEPSTDRAQEGEVSGRMDTGKGKAVAGCGGAAVEDASSSGVGASRRGEGGGWSEVGPVQRAGRAAKRLGQRGLRALHRQALARGWRVNLRFIAEKQFLLLLLIVCLLIHLVRRVATFIASWR